jgi:geranylgeranyl reductase family protein
MSNNFNHYDITVVGAGPAGSILAYELARRGVKVLLLERANLPRSKVCAGGITVRANSLLPFDVSKSGIVLSVIYGARLTFHMGSEKVKRYDKPLTYTVMREKFDHLLTTLACQAGATLVEGLGVKHIQMEKSGVAVTTERETFSTPLLVGADGANSAVVQSLGLRPGFEYGLGLNGHIEVDPKTYSRWEGLIGLDLGVPGGYSWIFPKEGSLAIGAGGSFRVARGLKPYVLKMMRSFDINSSHKYDIRGHLMPVRKPATPIAFSHVLLVGDAAGLIDPLSGEGIYYGLRSVKMAAPVIMRYLEGKTIDLAEYQSAVDRELMPEFKIARAVQKLNSVVPQIFFERIRNNDRFWRAFCGMLRGDRTYVSLKKSIPQPIRLLFRLF